jgi:hypothetical protein
MPQDKKQTIFWEETLSMIENFEKPNCPHCKKGRLRFAGTVPVEGFVPI